MPKENSAWGANSDFVLAIATVLAFCVSVQGSPIQGSIEDRLAGSARREDSGWIVLTLAGEPRNIGYQYGSLASREISQAHAALRDLLRWRTGRDWNWYREQTRRLFWSKLDPEYQQEMEGQAEGLAAKGVKLDVWDVLAFNGYIEVSDYYLPWSLQASAGAAGDSCSAFVATGSATADGKPVIGHNLWWDWIMGPKWNVVLDIRPKRGHRILMDCLSGFLHSGSDFAMNSAGIALCETTISNFKGFDPNGIPAFMRMRKAIQYSKNLDDVYGHFFKGNNGGYANTWLMVDANTNEIGKLELGLKNVIFHRSTQGWYVGSNFPEDAKLIAEETEGWDDSVRSNGCLRRQVRWQSLLTRSKGRIDAERSKGFLADTFDEVLNQKGASDGTICGRSDAFGAAHGAINTKVASAAQIRGMTFWARMGISDGSTFQAAPFLARNPRYAPVQEHLRDIPSYPWVLLRNN